MAKLGKFSSGIDVAGPKNYAKNNGQGGKLDMHMDLKMEMRKGGTATGKSVLVSTKRTKNPGNK